MGTHSVPRTQEHIEKIRAANIETAARKKEQELRDLKAALRVIVAELAEERAENARLRGVSA